MKSFFTSKTKNSDGEYELHMLYCEYLPYISDREYIGIFEEVSEAVNEAKKRNCEPLKICTQCCQKITT